MAVVCRKRRRAGHDGYSWAVLTYDVCVACGWVPGAGREDREKAREEARKAKKSYLEENKHCRCRVGCAWV